MSRILDAKTFVREVAPFVMENIVDAKRRGDSYINSDVCVLDAVISKDEAVKAVEQLRVRYPLSDGYHLAAPSVTDPLVYQAEGGKVCLALRVSWDLELRSARQVYGS